MRPCSLKDKTTPELGRTERSESGIHGVLALQGLKLYIEHSNGRFEDKVMELFIYHNGPWRANPWYKLLSACQGPAPIIRLVIILRKKL